MLVRVAKFWRQARLGAAFVEFAIVALFVGLVVGPLVHWRAKSAREAELGVQRAIQRAFAFSARCWGWLGVLRVRTRGLERLGAEGPCIVVANHPGLMDVVMLGAHMEQMDCIVNAGWSGQSPFLSRGINAAGYVRNDGGDAVVEECAERVRQGHRLLVFPEGTRSPRGGLGKLHRGAAHMALRSGAPLVVVTIHCDPPLLGGGGKWHDVGSRCSDYEMRIAGRLNPEDYTTGDETPSVAARRMTADLRTIFLQELNLADS